MRRPRKAVVAGSGGGGDNQHDDDDDDDFHDNPDDHHQHHMASSSFSLPSSPQASPSSTFCLSPRSPRTSRTTTKRLRHKKASASLASSKSKSKSISSTNAAIIVIGVVSAMYLLLFYVAHSRLHNHNETNNDNVDADSQSTTMLLRNSKPKLEKVAQLPDPDPTAFQYIPNKILMPTTSWQNEKPSLFNKQSSRHRQFEKREKKTGKIVYKPITEFHKDDIGPELLAKNATRLSYDEAIQGREHLVEILHDAGVEEIDVEVVASLPKWDSITKLYGNSGPVIVGLERCEEFQQQASLDDASMGTAGMFNTGTNPFAMYLQENCIMPHNKHDKAGGTRWQVPWGKHMLASRKWNNTAKRDERVNKTNVMPIILVRDPYSWMQVCMDRNEIYNSTIPVYVQESVRGQMGPQEEMSESNQ
mmetsp:Transcript_24945/g.59278  ORF Transcript_24945/g.59278 Transcript_24945/m.59278 type:complete len:418 (+) Transcript_24945:129-1382(+)